MSKIVSRKRQGSRRHIPTPSRIPALPPPDIIVRRTEWNLNVPKILHVYWGGGIMPYMRYLTVKSFIDLNPDWEVLYWYPKYPTMGTTWTTSENSYELHCTDYFKEFLNLPMTKTAVDFEHHGFSNSMAEVHKSDFFRSFLLATYGGVWTDMDIIYFKPMISLEINDPFYKEKETFVCINNYGHSIGFMMALPRSKFFERLANYARIDYNPNLYQCMGPELFNKHGASLSAINVYSPAVNIKMDAVYAHNAYMIAELWDGSPPRFTEFSIGVHWYAGHRQWGEFLNQTDGGLSNLPNCIMSSVLRKFDNIIT